MNSIVATPVDIDYPLHNMSSFSQQLKFIHEKIQTQYPPITRIDVTLHDPDTDALKSLSASCVEHNCLPYKFASKMSKMMSLLGLAKNNKARVINDHSVLDQNQEGLVQKSGLHSSLTVPFMVDDHFGGFTSFSARKRHYFTPHMVEQIHVYAQLINQLIASEQRSIANLRSAVSAYLKLNNVSGAESPEHLKRVAHYSRMIAEHVADRFLLSEEWIDHLFMFAPLHDIGKIFIPEHILMKPEKLSADEFKQVQLHTVKGREMIDSMIESFGYRKDIHYTEMLRNIITYHHEAIDGSGYPEGLKGDEIPLEAKIVAVADVLDALTTERPYKAAWPLDRTLSLMQDMADRQQLDQDLVEILVSNKEQFIESRKMLAA